MQRSSGKLMAIRVAIYTLWSTVAATWWKSRGYGVTESGRRLGPKCGRRSFDLKLRPCPSVVVARSRGDWHMDCNAAGSTFPEFMTEGAKLYIRVNRIIRRGG